VAADLLAVGLGNPGTEYQGTRHNVGVEVLELLAARHGGSFRMSKKERALVADVRVGPHRLALAFPQTYMNLSGESVGPLMRRFEIDGPEHLVVIQDELDLEPGRLKIKVGGGLAGHNGLKSIKAHVGSADFIRIRIGVGKPPGRQHGKDHVLRKPGKADRAVLDVAVQDAADAVEMILDHGPERAMERYNRKPE
jgi:PTH1 family peptidyl-tRNA hydrolase